ncbi:MAG: hypothetical protein WC784_06740 [Candidatus Shapirobacteria bacterium]
MKRMKRVYCSFHPQYRTKQYTTLSIIPYGIMERSRAAAGYSPAILSRAFKMPQKPPRYTGYTMSLLERSRLAIMQYLSNRFRLLFKSLDEKEVDRLEGEIEDALYKAFQDSKKFEEAEKENRKPHEYASRSSGVEAQSLHVYGSASKYNRLPVLSKRGWK